MANKRVTLTAKEGYIYTDGENYLKVVHLAIGADPKNYYQITEDEYNKIIEELQQEEK